MPTFERAGLSLAYEDLGGPADHTVVFLHGLLLSQSMMEPVARAFSGFRPVLLELHGHGRSSRPADVAAYSMGEFRLDVVALLDHLGVERAGMFGTSLGANVALACMLDAPDRVAAAVLEMPVLERGARFARRMFRPVAAALRARRAPKALALASRRLPRLRVLAGFGEALALLAQDPVSGAAVIEGLLATAGRSRWEEVERCPVPALVVGHPYDPLHACADAEELARRLPNGHLVRASSVLELRLRPGRIVGQSKRFLDGAFGAGEAAAS